MDVRGLAVALVDLVLPAECGGCAEPPAVGAWCAHCAERLGTHYPIALDNAFGTLGLHRIALFVFEFNERAIRTYKRCGFVVEGRSRESIFRDGQWWDRLGYGLLKTERR